MLSYQGQQMATVFTYVGLFLIAMATLMYEVLLTRIFSVTTWYHFAFLSISVTLFGLAAGGIAVYLKPKYFTEEKTNEHLALSSLVFAGLSALAMLVHLHAPYLLGDAPAGTVITVSLMATLPFTIAAFTASGIAISLALTRFPKQVNYLYAADLLGAGLGCLAVVFTLRFVDGITDVFLISTLASIAALCFAQGGAARKIVTAGIAASALFGLAAAAQGWSYREQHPIIAVHWTKGLREADNLYQLWNSFSRVRVFGDPETPAPADAYGLSPKVVDTAQAKFLYLDIDGGAATPILKFDGEVSKVNHLFYEISNVAHHLRKNADVAVIGAGGGKDVLSALVFNQNHVTAIDINENIFKAVHGKYGEYSGNLKQHPKISLVNDEARSFITRTDQKFDIIQISMIDTWAATASGAYSLSENGLYTTDAFKILLNRLKPNGILTVSRWYAKGIPSEFYRLTALAAESLKQLGVKNPGMHIMAFRNMPAKKLMIPDGIGTLLVSKEPFSAEDFKNAQKLAADMQFELVYAGTTTGGSGRTGNGTAGAGAASKDENMARLASGQDPETAAPGVPFNLTPPTDDSPFFFQAISLKHLTNPQAFVYNMNVTNILAGLMLLFAGLATLVITMYCLRIPYLQTKDKSSVTRAAPLFAFFFAIGAGFMFIEISQIERLTIFLGHPVYGLSVVLFALLFSTGIGSFLSEYWLVRQKLDPRAAPAAIIVVLLLYAALSGAALEAANTQAVAVRIATATGLLFPIGVALGSAFPVGIKTAMRINPALAPWLWGINGASSVWTSVLAIIVAMFASITVSYFCGVLFYVMALIAIHLCQKEQTGAAQPPAASVVEQAAARHDADAVDAAEQPPTTATEPPPPASHT
jgi:predicted membrane-bound spermidine synthase